MAKLCSCKGLDPNCKKCFGSGYIDSPEIAPAKVKAEKPRKSLSISEKLATMTMEEVEVLAKKIISELDLRSKKQMQVLNSIPFNTNTFRRDFPEKFDQLDRLEKEKVRLRNDLFAIDQEIVSKNYNVKLRFGHFLSDKDVDAGSNRELKTLIREYKKLKNKGPK